jgi:hypothetical protein
LTEGGRVTVRGLPWEVRAALPVLRVGRRMGWGVANRQ